MKTVTVLNNSTGINFGIEGRDVKISDKMAIGDAEYIAGQYPGIYVEVNEVEPAEPAATGDSTGKTAKAGK